MSLVAPFPLGFRECSKLCSIASETNATITVFHNQQQGSSDSILSLIQLAVHKNDTVTLAVSSEQPRESYHMLTEYLK
jgi:phosphotransferase system HPr (HPr) family protein